ncbi:hypothetical protein FRB94_000653, partial [Tulasnella sp. JGI-2019a]
NFTDALSLFKAQHIGGGVINRFLFGQQTLASISRVRTRLGRLLWDLRTIQILDQRHQRAQTSAGGEPNEISEISLENSKKSYRREGMAS